MSKGLKRLIDEVGSEAKRLTVQGSAELASALFTNQGYVPYGSGQSLDLKKTNEGAENDLQRTGTERDEVERDRGGREM
jgi:hypothetical protein